MARETNSQDDTTRPDPGNKPKEPEPREIQKYLNKKYGGPAGIDQAARADFNAFEKDLEAHGWNVGNWNAPWELSPYLDPDDPALGGDSPPDPRANLVPLNPLGDSKHRMSPPETSGELEKQSNLRLSHPNLTNSDWKWPGTAEDAVLYLYSRPTKDNTKWFDNVWWKGASDLVMKAIKEYRQDDLTKIANQMGWPAFHAITDLYLMNNPPSGEPKIKGFNEPNTKKIPGFNAPGKTDGILKRPMNGKIPGFNVPTNDDMIKDNGKPRGDKIPGFNAPD